MRESWTDERLDHLNEKVDRRFDEVDRRLGEIDRRLDRFEGQFGRIDQRIDSLGKIMIFGFISMTGAIVACFAALLPRV